MPVLQCSSLDEEHKQRDDVLPTETAPLMGGDVRPFSYYLLFSFEGRLNNLLCHLIFQWDSSTIEQHCAGYVWWVFGIHSKTAYQSP